MAETVLRPRRRSPLRLARLGRSPAGRTLPRPRPLARSCSARPAPLGSLLLGSPAPARLARDRLGSPRRPPSPATVLSLPPPRLTPPEAQSASAPAASPPRKRAPQGLLCYLRRSQGVGPAGVWIGATARSPDPRADHNRRRVGASTSAMGRVRPRCGAHRRSHDSRHEECQNTCQSRSPSPDPASVLRRQEIRNLAIIAHAITARRRS